MKTTNRARIAGLLAASAMFSATAYAQGWDARADFSYAANPSGAWSYGYKPSATGASFHLCERVQAGYGWYHFAWTAAPAIGAGSTALNFHPAGLLEGTGYASCLRWTAPTSGTYRVSAVFHGTSNTSFDIGQTAYVIENGTVVYQDTILSYGQTRAYTNVFTLSSGSTIDVVVANNGGIDNNWTGVSVGITPADPITPPPFLSIRVSQVELCWDTVTNTWYQLQYRSTLTTNSWLPLSTNWVAGDGTRFCATDAVLGGEPQKFYQLAVTNSHPQ